MTMNLEANPVSWEDGALLLGRLGEPGCVRVSTPVSLCLPGGEVAIGAYSEVREREGGWRALGSVCGSDGTRVDVIDDWAPAGATVALQRQATVTEAGTAAGV